MPNRAKKSTKKFEKNHLKDVLERRKDFAKIKQRQQIKAKRKARNASDKARASDEEQEPAPKKARKSDTQNPAPFNEKSVDEFIQDAFELPEIKHKQGKHTKITNGVKEGFNKTGKRKRDDDGASEEGLSDSGISEEQGDVLDDEGEESAEEGGLEMHQDDLDALAEKDPEFYKYLKENDAELLDFDEDGFEDDQSIKPDEPKRKKQKSKEPPQDSGMGTGDGGSEVTMAMVKKWKTALSEQHSLAAMKQIVLAFRSATFVNTDDAKEQKYSISSPEVYHQLLVVALEHIPDVLRHHLPVQELASGKIRIATESKKYRNTIPLLKIHAASIQRLLENLSDASTTKLTVSSLIPLLPYLLSHKKVLRGLCKTCVEIWSDIATTEATRVTAFIFIRRLVVTSDASIREAVLKTTYQGLVKGSRTTNVHTLAGINLMKNSAAELWGLDANIGYTTGFNYIRQLAIHLRQTVNHPSSDSYKTIYNWQYVHALDFWSRVLSTHCSPANNPNLKEASSSPLHPLIYPLVQITMGALRLIPTPTYFPLRFHLSRALLRLSFATTTFIPLAPSLLEVLSSPECSKSNPKPSTLAPLDFSIILRAPKSYLGTRVYQDGLDTEISELLAEFFHIWTKHIAFPELALPPIVHLKRWLKAANSKSHDAKISSQRSRRRGGSSKTQTAISLLVQKLELNTSFIEGKRREVRFGPTDREEVENFLRDVPSEDTPLGGFVVGERKRKEEREKILKEGRREDQQGKNEMKVAQDDISEDKSEDEAAMELN
ncbi:MAG: Nucleolar Complex 2 protein [Heterodermia speciosa]|uniref:Nucleolar Complex 2 protein n=1 Tax=Heterodermia speciosa TaxID=116794 RepID=A0A8H3FH72_9LECA|nr:MAG: Nucleolar Complex 2 protein [Heterodermia speciosa]